uniref:Uncharacterized protein LOC114342317 n=1 Tax=Diabrotica virgifera virgifera TaxID=50390 RepID=A0A6P7GU53_DIAVI
MAAEHSLACKWKIDVSEFDSEHSDQDPFLNESEDVKDYTLVNSNSTRVTLKKVERDTAGKFKCEVSADAPLFHTDIRTAELIVADVPEDGPVLRTEAQKVAPGEKIKANCTTPGSYPTMNISWFANNIEVILFFTDK